ncbi:hypothetical protein KUIN1_08910 [Pseudomonas sp. KUIN-1]|nr:hypothetical protein KUIN1_08910 [Pseudomonas sp. KUIN-1]
MGLVYVVPARAGCNGKTLEYTSLLKSALKAKQRACAAGQTDRPALAKLTYLQHAHEEATRCNAF